MPYYIGVRYKAYRKLEKRMVEKMKTERYETLKPLVEYYGDDVEFKYYSLSALKTIKRLFDGEIINDWKLDYSIPAVYMTKHLYDGWSYLTIICFDDGTCELSRFDKTTGKQIFKKDFKSLNRAMKSDAWF